MKKFMIWIVVAVMGCIGAMIYIHRQSIQEIGRKSSQLQLLYQRQGIINDLSLNLERYRRKSAGFRNLSNADISQVKEHLRSAFRDGVENLDHLDPTTDDRTNESKVNESLDELMRVSEKLEPMLYSRDAYAKPEVRSIHDEIASTLSQMKESAQGRLEALNSTSSRSAQQSIRWLLASGALIVALILGLLFRNYLVLIKPLNRLHAYAADLKVGNPVPARGPVITGICGDIQSALNQLAHWAETHLKERHKFVKDVVSDLKGPLTMLQVGNDLLGRKGDQLDESQQIQAAGLMRRGLAILSGSLEDLTDLIEIGRLESRLNEKVVDLAEVISEASKTLSGTASGKQITTTVPSMPVWMNVDPRRTERALIQVISKVMSTLSPSSGGRIAVVLTHASQGNFRGIEILVREADVNQNGKSVVSGPEVELLKHWISEDGLSMALAQKIVKAQGGAITASGVAGTSVQIRLRLPQERVVSRGLILPPSGLQVDHSQIGQAGRQENGGPQGLISG